LGFQNDQVRHPCLVHVMGRDQVGGGGEKENERGGVRTQIETHRRLETKKKKPNEKAGGEEGLKGQGGKRGGK